MTELLRLLLLLVSFLPFALLVFLDTKMNLRREVRARQYFMPVVALVYCVLAFLLMRPLGNLCMKLVDLVPTWLDSLARSLAARSEPAFLLTVFDVLSRAAAAVAAAIRRLISTVNPVYILLVVFNTLGMVLYLVLKAAALTAFRSKKADPDSANALVDVFYDYDERTGRRFIRPNFGQARTFLKSVFYSSAFISALLVAQTWYLGRQGRIASLFYPIFPIILIGEAAFFIDGCGAEELHDTLGADVGRSDHITNYAILRRKLKELFGDKLTADASTVNSSITGGAVIDTVLVEIEEEYGHIGKNYALFIRSRAEKGNLVPDANYLKSGVELASGKSLLFNTPFYYKLCPYVFYAMQSSLLRGGKALIILGRHGTSDDVLEWCRKGLFEISSVPNLWKIGVLGSTPTGDDEENDVSIITRSGVHDTELHKANRSFLRKVTFVVLVEPSRLVATAQIGLNLLVGNFGDCGKPVYCSVDRNCDGLVDSLSHILMTDITEVSATEYPMGVSSYMCWLADGDHLQHRLTPGISRFLGTGTELSFAALKKQVEQTVWYGGEAFPVCDEHWIAKQYYYDLLRYAELPTTQETFDKVFRVSYNICNEQVRADSYLSVEDEFFNLFEVRRELATIAEHQGFVNVISTEYMLREYMTDNCEIFSADSKAIPYITADYARTKRNVILRVCLRMTMNGILKKDLAHELLLIADETDEEKMIDTVWQGICGLFGRADGESADGILVLKSGGNEYVFGKEIISQKHEYSEETGRFEDFLVITGSDFRRIVLDDLQNAKYVAEQEADSSFLGTELKGHILQKYLPGQFFTRCGKYYEMVGFTGDDKVLVRRASEHITSRYSYRQTRLYDISFARNAENMGDVRNVNGIRMVRQFADFTVETPSYWRLEAYNDFEHGVKVDINDVPVRSYFNKQILMLDFSDFGESFTEKIRTTLTLLINEIFLTLFAENQPYIVAVTKGSYDHPLTFSLSGDAAGDNAIYIIEDSQLDIGLLVSVERNVERILKIAADYLLWHTEELERSISGKPKPSAKLHGVEDIPHAEENASEKPEKPKNVFKRFFGWFKGLFKGKKKSDDEPCDALSPRERRKREKEERKKAKAEEKAAKKAAKEAAKEAKKADKAAAKAAKAAEAEAKKAAKKEAAEAAKATEAAEAEASRPQETGEPSDASDEQTEEPAASGPESGESSENSESSDADDAGGETEADEPDEPDEADGSAVDPENPDEAGNESGKEERENVAVQ